MRKQAVIFDMDGVLIDSEPFYLKNIREFLERYGGHVDESLMKAIAGASRARTWRLVAQMWKEKAEAEEVERIFRAEYGPHHAPYREVMFPEVPELLKRLREKGLTLAIASSSSDESIGNMMRETGISQYFSLTVSGQNFRESKPNPEVYLYTLSRLGLPEEACIVVEDSTYGIQAAKRAGLQVAARRDERFSFDQSEADYIIERTGDIEKILEKIG